MNATPSKPNASSDWFSVDRAGLAKLLERKGIAHVVLEPLSNAWDENVTRVEVSLSRVPGTKLAALVVSDDSPAGFADLSHAYRLFAESSKKGNAGQRGRYNAGDKLVLALCDTASIQSTTGTVVFDKTGRRTTRAKTERGSIFSCQLKLTTAQIEECNAVIARLLPPAGIKTFYNGELVPVREPVATIEASLQTELADAEGVLRRSQRRTQISIFEPAEGEPAMLYELGIPVCETGDRFHVSIGQKVPLDIERTQPPQAFLSRVRALVLEATHASLTAEDATSPWVRNALHDHPETVPVEAVRQVAELRFGTKAVAFDPSDPEANNIAAAQGYKVVYGGQMSGAEWQAIRRSGALMPAGQVTPSPKPYSESGNPLKAIDPSAWTSDIQSTVLYCKRIAARLINRQINVVIASDITWPFAATYGSGQLTFNLGRLGHKWFEGPLRQKNDLLLHELGHEFAFNHLSTEYHTALTSLGAALTQLALDEPDLFRL